MKKRLFAAVFLFSGILYAQETPKVEYGPQIVLVVHKSANGVMQVVPTTQVWFRIGPISPESRPAPLPEGTNMLCHAHDLHATNGMFLAMKCGMDDYLVQAVGINPEK